MAVREVSEREFESEVMQNDLPVLVEFGAQWCGPCKATAPELAALAEELAGKAKILTVDIDKSPLLARELGIQSVPTFVIFDKGRPVGAKTGAMRRAQLREILEPFLPRALGSLTPEQVAALLQQRAISLVDTREASDWRRLHLPDAVNIPLGELQNRLAELYMLPGMPVLYCRSGELTKALVEKLAAEGVEISFLEGGVLAWESAGLPIQRPS